MIAVLDDYCEVEIHHELKTWCDAYQEIVEERKLYEFRKNDRDFKLGDFVLLREFEPAGERYTQRESLAKITSISYGPEWGIPVGFAVFSIRLHRFRRLIPSTAPPRAVS